MRTSVREQNALALLFKRLFERREIQIVRARLVQALQLTKGDSQFAKLFFLGESGPVRAADATEFRLDRQRYAAVGTVMQSRSGQRETLHIVIFPVTTGGYAQEPGEKHPNAVANKREDGQHNEKNY
jgi:hypothetical protein